MNVGKCSVRSGRFGVLRVDLSLELDQGERFALGEYSRLLKVPADRALEQIIRDAVGRCVREVKEEIDG